MVLENSTTDDFGDNSAPPSDYDAYASNNPNGSNSDQHVIEASIFRTPWTSKEYVAKYVGYRVGAVGFILQRPPTLDEVNYAAYWSSKMLYIQSCAKPIGIIAGLARAYQTRATYKFPFWTPNLETLRPHEVYPHPRFVVLTGLGGQLAWHSLRASLYIGLNWGIALIFFTSYAASTCTIGAAADPRGEKIREVAKRRGATLVPLAYPNPRGEDKRNKQKEVPGREVQRPAGTEYENTTDNGEYQSNDSMQSQNESPLSWQEGDATQSSPFTNGVPSNPSQTQENRSQPTQVRPTPAATSGGSAWDRIRQQSGKPQSAPSPSESSERGTYDTYAPKGPDDTQVAREKAQKEFDEQIERERQGESFDSGSERGFKRW